MMNGDFTLVTVPGMGRRGKKVNGKKKGKEIPLKSATDGKLETDAKRGPADIYCSGLCCIFSLNKCKKTKLN